MGQYLQTLLMGQYLQTLLMGQYLQTLHTDFSKFKMLDFIHYMGDGGGEFKRLLRQTHLTNAVSQNR